MLEPARAVTEPAACQADAMQARLQAAAITAASIPDPPAVDPRPRPPGDRFRADATFAWPSPPTSAPSPRLGPGDGLRLIPLEGFHWGGVLRGRDLPPSPRVRGDHALLLLTAGALQIEFPRHHHALMPQHVAFIPAGTAFALQPGAEVRGRALLIAPAHGRTLPLPLPAAFRHGLSDPADGQVLKAAMLALGAAHDAGASATNCQLAVIAAALSRLGQAQGPFGACSIAQDRALTQAFLELARQNLAQNQTLAEMAVRLGCTQAHLDRACRQSHGRTALDLLYDLRLQSAAQALCDSTRSVAEIAQDLGYAGTGHFMRSFAAATGRTPEAYRQAMRPSQKAD